jgi:DNA-binding response OmpR family regulator
MPSGSAPLRALVVDDNPEVAYVLTETLTSMGYAVQTAVHGQEAVELFEADPPAVVLLDLRMPGMHGGAVFAELQRIDATVPVIVVTATWDESLARKLLHAGAVDLVHKPIDLDYLRLSVTAATGRPWPAEPETTTQPGIAKSALQQLAYAVVALSRRVVGPDPERIRLEKLTHQALRHALSGRSDFALECLLELRQRLQEGTLAWMTMADTEALRAELEALDRRVLAPAVIVPVDANATLPNDGSLQGVRVLVVDDDPDACELMRVALELSGAAVSTADSAEDGLRTVKTTPPDVLVSDIAMPGHDGYWLVREARAVRRAADATIRTLAVTAHAAHHDRALALTCGFDDHLAKPIDPSELCRRVAALLVAA